MAKQAEDSTVPLTIWQRDLDVAISPEPVAGAEDHRDNHLVGLVVLLERFVRPTIPLTAPTSNSGTLCGQQASSRSHSSPDPK